MSGSGIHAATGRSKWAETRGGRPSPCSPPRPGRGRVLFLCLGWYRERTGDASRVTIAESYREDVPLRSIARRTTDASPLRVLWLGRLGDASLGKTADRAVVG